MRNIPDEEIVSGLKENNESIIRYVYKTNLNVVRQMVRMNLGTDEEADDIFQEALMVVFRKINTEGFKLTSSFGTFFFSIARNLWLIELRKKSKKESINENADTIIYDESDIEAEHKEEAKQGLIWKHFKEITQDCQKIILLFIKGHSIAEVTKIMNYSSEQHTKNRRLRCKNSLITKIETDPKFKELKNDKQRNTYQVSRW